MVLVNLCSGVAGRGRPSSAASKLAWPLLVALFAVAAVGTFAVSSLVDPPAAEAALPAAGLAPNRINLGPAGGAVDVAAPAGTPLGLLDRDGGVSVRLSDGNELWVFADTTLTINGHVAWFSHRGTGAIAPPSSPFSLHEPSVASGWILTPSSHLIEGGAIGCPPGYGDFYWPSSAVSIPQGGGRDRVLIYYQALCGAGDDLSTFYSVATGVAQYDYDAGAPPSVERPIRARVLNGLLFAPMPGHSAPGASYGVASVMAYGMVHAYGCRYSPILQFCRVGRAAPADVADGSKYEFWTGSTWVHDVNQAADMNMPAPLVGVKTSVAWIPGLARFVMVDNDWPGPDMAIRFATKPEGPWTTPTMVNIPDCVGTTCYAGEIHASLSDAHALTVTYFAQGKSRSPRAVQIPVYVDPFGYIDSISSNAPNQLSIGGWTIDPDLVAPISVHVYVDGRFAAAWPADGSRPDVGAVYPYHGPNHGYRGSITGLAGGAHQVCVYALNGGVGTNNPLIGCTQVNVQNAFGPVVGKNSDGRLEVFASDAMGGLTHAVQVTPGGVWSQWLPMNVSSATAPVVATNSDGRLEVFRTDASGNLMHAWQSPGTNTGWSGWEWMGVTVAAAPVVGNNADGRLEMFARGPGQRLLHTMQVAGVGWAGWNDTGASALTQPAMGANADGRLEVFVPNAEGALLHSWQKTPNGAWSGWEWSSSYTGSTPAVSRSLDGRLEIFSTRPDGNIEHSWQRPVIGGWSAWAGLGAGSRGPLTASVNSAGLLELFAPATNGALIHSYQVPNSASGWSGWYPMGTYATLGPAVGGNPDGSIELFVVDGAGRLLHLIGATTGWGAWTPITPGAA